MPNDAATAEGCAAWIRKIYGQDTCAPGVLHIAAVCCDAAGRWRSLEIRDETPKSSTDRFVLAVARARADAIVTTGRILRREPALRHALPTDGPLRGVAAWRHGVLGKPGAATSVVLTGRADLDLTHPLLASGAAIVVGSEEVTSALGVRAGVRGAVGLELAARPRPGLRDTLEWLRSERGAATILVEAGPATSADLYEAPVAVDELLLSVYRGPPPPPRVVGGAFVPRQRVDEVFGTGSADESEYRSDEESGSWSFLRFRRTGSSRPIRNDRFTRS